MQTRDKKYVENLLRQYKKNKARLSIIENGLISDDDYILGAVDYSKDRVQTSNLGSLDNIVERREKEKERLMKDILLAETLLNSLTERDHNLMYSFYVERKTLVRIAQMLDRDDTKTIWRNKERILEEMLEVM